MWLIVASLTTVAVYWVGLQGPLLFDDINAFATLRGWVAGENSLAQVVFGNTSWVTHRALAMGSFAAHVAIWGFKPFYFKLFNLLLHVVIGLVIYRVLSRFLRRDNKLAARPNVVALMIAIVWLLHPLQVTTVLYAVQRMAQWAALACLIGVWLYSAIRDRLEQGNTRGAWMALFLGIPALVLIGIQGKQNAVVLPALCLVLELAYYRNPRPLQVKAFFAVFLVAPTILGVFAMMVWPDRFFGEYVMYDFTMGQRLLSEARVLCDYLGQLLIPHTPSMGVFTDDYKASTGWLDPPTTLLAVATLAIVTIFVWAVRARFPSLFAGWFLFLAAHGVESTVLPLELYYEHRNYLPSLGVFLAAAALITSASSSLSSRGVRMGRVGAVCAAALLVTLAGQTFGRARVWSDSLLLFSSEFRHHPESIRALINFVGVASDVGDLDTAYAAADRTIKSTNDPRLKAQTLMFRTWLDCTTKQQANPADLAEAVKLVTVRVDTTTYHLIDLLAATISHRPCAGIGSKQLARAFETLGDQATAQPIDSLVRAGIRNRAALLYISAGDWDRALAQASLGWQPKTANLDGALLIEALLVHGDTDRARSVLESALSRPTLTPLEAQRYREFLPLIATEIQEPGYNRRRVSASGTQAAVEGLLRRDYAPGVPSQAK